MDRDELEREGLLDGVETPAEREARIALVQELLDAGVSLEEVKRAIAEDRLALLPVERVFAQESKYTIGEAAEMAGLPEDFIRRDWMALGLSQPGPEDHAFSEASIEGLKGLKQLLEVGLPEAEVLELARVSGQGSAKLAQAIMQTLGNVFIQPGDTERDLGLRYAEIAMRLLPTLAPLAENPLRLHIRETIRREMVGRAERLAGRLPGSRDVAVCFADLVDFTRLGESLPVTEIGSVAEQLESMASRVAKPPVRLVKMIGDAAMFVSPDARSGVEAALELVVEADAQPEFPSIRAGMAYGPALARLGDWYGRPVNLASRITAVAHPGSVLATRDVRAAAGDGYRWSRVRSQRFKGVQDEVKLYRVRPSRTDADKSAKAP
jgi:adenylate cyclase